MQFNSYDFVANYHKLLSLIAIFLFYFVFNHNSVPCIKNSLNGVLYLLHFLTQRNYIEECWDRFQRPAVSNYGMQIIQVNSNF